MICLSLSCSNIANVMTINKRLVSFLRNPPFQSVFATGMATKGSWGIQGSRVYRPDAYSDVASTVSSGDGRLIKSQNKKGRSDFQDSPWYDNRGATPRGAESHGGELCSLFSMTMLIYDCKQQLSLSIYITCKKTFQITSFTIKFFYSPNRSCWSNFKLFLGIHVPIAGAS